MREWHQYLIKKKNEADIQRGNVKSRGNKIKNNKKDDSSGENYDRLSILIPNRIGKKLASRRKKTHCVCAYNSVNKWGLERLMILLSILKVIFKYTYSYTNQYFFLLRKNLLWENIH